MKNSLTPTNKDLTFGKIAATIAVEHSVQIAQGKRDGSTLSEKIARALKKFRVENERIRKKNKAAQLVGCEKSWDSI